MHDLRTFALTLPVLLVAMVLHELAHGAVAWRLGDPTARMMGRLTLNPVRHLDRLGTVMFALTFFGGLAANVPGFAIGWAKPVPVVPEHFRSPQRGMALVAVAGPLTNLLIAAAFAAIVFHVHLAGVALDVAVLALLVNITLFLFNLLPIPPLDGGQIFPAIWESIRRRIARLRGRPDPGPVDVAKLMPVAYVVAIVFIAWSGLLFIADIINPVTLS